MTARVRTIVSWPAMRRQNSPMLELARSGDSRSTGRQGRTTSRPVDVALQARRIARLEMGRVPSGGGGQDAKEGFSRVLKIGVACGWAMRGDMPGRRLGP